MSNVIEFSVRAVDDFTAVMNKAGGAFSKLGSAFTALQAAVVPYALIRFSESLINAVDEAERASIKLNAILKGTGHAAGTTRDEIEKMVIALESTTRFDDEGLRNAAAEILKFGYMTKESFAGALDVATKFAFFTGSEIPAAAATIARAMTHPEAASRLLMQAGAKLTEVEKHQIKTMQELGDAAGAQALVLKKLQGVYGDMDSGLSGVGGKSIKLKEHWDDLLETLGKSPIINKTIAASIDKLNDTVRALDASVTTGSFLPWMRNILKTAEDMPGAAGKLASLLAAFATPSAPAKNVVTGMIKYAPGQSPLELAQQEAAAQIVRDANTVKQIAATEAARKAAADAGLAIAKSVADLEKQAATYGMTASQIKMYELATQGATNAQLAAAAISAQSLDAQEAKAEADKVAKDAADVLAESNRSIVEGMETAAATYGMTADQVNIYTLAMQGASEAQIQTAVDIANNNIAMQDQAMTFEGLVEAQMERAGTLAEQTSQIMLGAFNQLSAGVGSAVAQTIVDGESLSKGLENVAKSVAKTIIATLVQIGVQRLILAIMDNGATATTNAIKLGAGVSEVFVNSFASAAAIPMIGWAMAPGVAMANTAAAVAGIPVAKASGMAAGAAHGGLDYVPAESTYLLDKGERVLSPRQNQDLTGFLQGGGSGGGMVIQNLEIHVMENATNVDAFARMDRGELREKLGRPVVDALNEMWKMGTRPDFARNSSI